MYQGDSVCSSEDISTAVAVEPDDGDAPAQGEGAPTKRRDFKPPPPPRPPRDTTPVDPQSRVEGSARPERTSNFTPKESNVGWFFANWGQIPKSGAKRDHIDSVLKKQPATIIGLTECDAITDAYLRRAGWKGGPQLREADDPPSRVDDTMKERDAYQYLTLRGSEEHSVLIGVRVGPGTDLEMLFWERRLEGMYQRKNKSRAKAYSRCLIARVTLEHSAGALGTQHVVMVNHVHNMIANLGVGSPKLQSHLNWLADNIQKHKVQVIMGDYNMACFHAVSVFRERGIVVDVGAWYPFTSLEGVPMSDICAVFSVNLRAEYRFHHGLECLHANDETGLFHKSRPQLRGAPKTLDMIGSSSRQVQGCL